MGFGVAVLLVGVCVLGQPLDSAAFEAPPCIKANGTVVEVKDISPEMLKWAKEGVDAHNKFRKKHGVPPLVFNPNMCKSSQWTANRTAVMDRYIYAATTYPDGMQCGETLDTSIGRILKPASWFVQKWYDLIKDYDFDKHKPKPGKEPYEFQKIVWKATKEMCMTHAQALSGQRYVAAHYFTPGDWNGGDKENVFNSANHDHFKTGIILILILCGYCFSKNRLFNIF